MKFTGVVLLIMDLYGLTASLVRHYHINEKMTWSDAQEYCRHHYEDLSTIDSKKELEQINESSPVSGWIGLHRDVLYQSQWKWSGGGDTEFQYWNYGEPRNIYDYDCAYVNTKNKRWSTTNCSLLLRFFCMTNTRELIIVWQSKSWEQAMDYCRNHYVDLASLRSEEENAEAVNMSHTAQTEYLWTGLRFLAGQWFWVSNDDLDYQAWATGHQPQCPSSHLHCGALEKNKEIWTPRDCEEKLSFICFKN